MRTIYGFKELSKSVQNHVIAHWRDGEEFHLHPDWIASLKGFEKVYQVKVSGLDTPGGEIDIEILVDKGLSGVDTSVRMWMWMWMKEQDLFDSSLIGRTCPFTGYYYDETLIDPIREFHSNRDHFTLYQDLMHECVTRWLAAYNADIDRWRSDERIRDEIRTSLREFDADGNVYEAILPRAGTVK